MFKLVSFLLLIPGINTSEEKTDSKPSRLVALAGFCKYGWLDHEHASGEYTISISLGFKGVR
jgi:hypothetical protein